jgi:putative restriction endonuclease
MVERRKWTREESIIVFNLYCKIPFKNSSKFHPEVIRVANLIGRTPSAVNMKIGNFGSFDENLKKKGIVGLENTSKLDKEIWDEFNGNWDELAFMSEQLVEKLSGNEIVEEKYPLGEEKIGVVKQRVNQNFFRKAILASYNETCCITGINTEKLLVASHIMPWSVSDSTNKTNPRNGLCLNALHDKAFDKGLLTVTDKYIIHVSSDIRDVYDGKTVEEFFGRYEGEKIILPEKFCQIKLFCSITMMLYLKVGDRIWLNCAN